MVYHICVRGQRQRQLQQGRVRLYRKLPCSKTNASVKQTSSSYYYHSCQSQWWLNIVAAETETTSGSPDEMYLNQLIEDIKCVYHLLSEDQTLSSNLLSSSSASLLLKRRERLKIPDHISTQLAQCYDLSTNTAQVRTTYCCTSYNPPCFILIPTVGVPGQTKIGASSERGIDETHE